MLERLFKPSTRAFWNAGKKQGLSFTQRLHGYAYVKWPYHYIGMAHGKYRGLIVLLSPIIWLLNRQHPFQQDKASRTGDPNQKRATFADTYHGKPMPLDQATKLVSINRPVQVEMPEQVIPYTRAREILFTPKTRIALLDCPCRAGVKNPCTPTEVCVLVGEELVDFLLEHHPTRCREVSAEEAVKVIKAENKRGHVAHAFFKDVMLGRFYAICNCCACCCGAMKAQRAGVQMLCSSGYVAKYVADECKKCGLCAKHCQFKAIRMSERGPVIKPKRCLGCGVCVENCPEQALHLELAPDRGIPLDVDQLVH